MENGFADFIGSKLNEAKELKIKINKYFRILNLIEYVIELDEKYSEPVFLDFWRRFNNEYNNINKQEVIIDDVEIYFDNKIGIVAPAEPKPKDPKTSGGIGGSTGSGERKFKFDILKVISKRNHHCQIVLFWGCSSNYNR
jgi:type I restriction enzyme R subunit